MNVTYNVASILQQGGMLYNILTTENSINKKARLTEQEYDIERNKQFSERNKCGLPGRHYDNSTRVISRISNFAVSLLVAFASIRIHTNSNTGIKTKMCYIGLIGIADVVVKQVIVRVNSYYQNQAKASGIGKSLLGSW